MSRTIRCKNQKPKESWLTSREEYEQFKELKWPKGYRKNWNKLFKDTFEKTRKAELAKAHSEHGIKYFFLNDVPSGFRRDLNARRRCRERMNLKISVRDNDGENYIVIRPGNCNDLWWMWD